MAQLLFPYSSHLILIYLFISPTKITFSSGFFHSELWTMLPNVISDFYQCMICSCHHLIDSCVYIYTQLDDTNPYFLRYILDLSFTSLFIHALCCLLGSAAIWIEQEKVFCLMKLYSVHLLMAFETRRHLKRGAHSKSTCATSDVPFLLCILLDAHLFICQIRIV